MNRKRVPSDGNVLRLKALCLCEEFQRKYGTEDETKPFTVRRGWLHRFRNRFNLKNINIIGEAALADEEAAATFPAELKKYQGEKYDPGIRLKLQNPLLSYIRESEKYTVNLQCTVQYTLLLHYLMLVMSYCV